MTLEECKTLFDPSRVKVLDGIAGSGKSSKLDSIMKRAGLTYKRYTSTNRLKRDAIARYGGHCDTIAGGLFETNNGEFFSSEKDPAGEIVVIDEILQTDRRVLDWIRHNVGEINIFVLTDTHQMLAPQGGKNFLRLFEEFKKESYVDSIDMSETLRARTKETKKYYEECYKSVADGNSLFYSYLKNHKPISFESMPFTDTDIYITHTKALEKKIYKKFFLYDRYDLDIIPKGTISRKEPKDPTRYPILPQEDVTQKVGGYYQLSGIGTPTRYQGSECDTTKKLYYIYQKGARIEPREWYTVVTRAYDINSIILVEAQTEKWVELKTFWGCPVKMAEWPELDGTEETVDGTPVSEKIEDGKKPRLDLGDIQAARALVKDTEDVHYREGGFLLNGALVLPKKEDEKKPKISMQGLLAKSPEYSYSFLPDFYKRYEELQIDYFGDCFSQLPASPMIKAREVDRVRESFSFGIDLQASYPHILDRCKLPIDGDFITEEDDRYMQSSPDFYSFCTVVDSKYVPDGCIISVETVLKLLDMGDDLARFGWLGACPARVGSMMGAKLMEMATSSRESNEERKAVRYGLAERQYLYGCESDGAGKYTVFAIEDRDNHAPLMWSIKDTQVRAMLEIHDAIYKGCGARYGMHVSDGFFFDYYESIKELGDDIKTRIPWADFRIYKQNAKDKEDCILYKTYIDPPSKTDIAKRNQKERQARYREKSCTKLH